MKLTICFAVTLLAQANAGAVRPKGFGLTAELSTRKAAQFDAELTSEVFQWMKAVLQDSAEDSADDLAAGLSNEVTSANDVQVALKNGVTLCTLINAIQPGSVENINTNQLAFKQLENIGNFLNACEKLGVNKADLFQTVDLYEGTNIPQVINGIVALGRKVNTLGLPLPTFGPQEAQENRREFTEEQLRAGEGVIGLQAGSNTGASQAGQNFGKTRAIID